MQLGIGEGGCEPARIRERGGAGGDRRRRRRSAGRGLAGPRLGVEHGLPAGGGDDVALGVVDRDRRRRRRSAGRAVTCGHPRGDGVRCAGSSSTPAWPSMSSTRAPECWFRSRPPADMSSRPWRRRRDIGVDRDADARRARRPAWAPGASMRTRSGSAGRRLHRLGCRSHWRAPRGPRLVGAKRLQLDELVADGLAVRAGDLR